MTLPRRPAQPPAPETGRWLVVMLDAVDRPMILVRPSGELIDANHSGRTAPRRNSGGDLALLLTQPAPGCERVTNHE